MTEKKDLGIDQNIETSIRKTADDESLKSNESPSRPKKKRIFDKTAIITRKSAKEEALNSGRLLRGRRNSTGKMDGLSKEPVKRVGKLTPELMKTAKRKREDSNKPDKSDLPQKLQKVEDIDKTLKTDTNNSNFDNNEEMNEIKIKKEPEDNLEVEYFVKNNVEEGTALIKEESEYRNDLDRKDVQSENISNSQTGKEKKGKSVSVSPENQRARRSDKVLQILEQPEPKRSKRLKKTDDIKKSKEDDDSILDNSKNNEKGFELESNSKDMLLIVDTTAQITEKSTDNNIQSDKIAESTSSDKAASLSPELKSEGISAISVKQFYKKPDFLENNLGIEKDPTLHDIVKNVNCYEVNTSTDIDTSGTSSSSKQLKSLESSETDIANSSESLLDGTLMFEEDTSVENSLQISKNENLSREHFSDIKLESIEITSEKIDINSIDMSEKNQVEKPQILQNELCDNEDQGENKAVDIDKIRSSDNDVKDKIEEDEENKNNIEYQNMDFKEKDIPLEKKEKCENVLVINEAEIIQKEKIPDENCEVEASRKEILKNNDKEMDERTEQNDIVTILNFEISCKETGNEIVDAVINETKVETNKKNISNKDLNFNEDKEKVDDAENTDSNTKNIKRNEISAKTTKASSSFAQQTKRKTLSTGKVQRRSAQKRVSETPESLRQKEKHLKTLGLLTHKAAVQAKIDKQRRKNFLQKSYNAKSQNSKFQETVYSIKLNRLNSMASPENKRKSASINLMNNGRQSLKITFQKGRGRTLETDSKRVANQSEEDAFYTIQNEAESAISQQTMSHGRKFNNRMYSVGNQNDSTDTTNKKEDKEKILIPEKASSFGIHPGRLCQDQCFYCGGKFGLYDTPCHVAQLKSAERQQKILENEEKLTIDNCLCDACFRHVDKRANVPSYRKRLEHDANSTSSNATSNAENVEEQGPSSNKSVCFVPMCKNSAAHSLRKKLIRKIIKKLLPTYDMATLGGIVPICAQHYNSILQYLGCALCKRRLGKNHMYHIQEVEKLEKILTDHKIPIQIGNSSAICKLCRYFANLLMKSPQGMKTQKGEFLQNYKKRLLQFHNIETDEEGNVVCEGKEDSNKIDDKIQSGTEDSKKTQENDETRVQESQLDTNVIRNDDNLLGITELNSTSSSELTKLKSILQSNKNDSNSMNEDVSVVLRSNPNISMRELFPGEEEIGLQAHLPFGSSLAQRTPEGWTRIQTFLQYDEPTRRLWEDLQKPYGNQSSFLRHLILLEKYYRNGDLVLSNSASSNATVYSQSVQNRLRSYDSKSSSSNVETALESKSTPEKGKNNYPVTITAASKHQTQSIPNFNHSKDISNDRESLLKSNLVVSNKNAIEILPIITNSDSNSTTNTISKQEKILAAANKLIGNNVQLQKDNEAQVQNKTDSPSVVGLPPQLISINRQQFNTLQKHQMHQSLAQQLVKAKAIIKKHIIVLPDCLSPQERQCAGVWRPTLMPLSAGVNLKKCGQLYQTVDGRRLPSLVQVQSGGKPFLISIYDYNRMCILRREKLMREQILKRGHNVSDQMKNQKTSQSNLQLINKVHQHNSLTTSLGQIRPTPNIDELRQKFNKQLQHHYEQHRKMQQNINNNPPPKPHFSLHKPPSSTITSSSNFIPILPKVPQTQKILPTTSANNKPSGSFFSNSVSIIPTISNVLSLAPSTINSSSNSTSSWFNQLNGNNTSAVPKISTITSGSLAKQQQQQLQNYIHSEQLKKRSSPVIDNSFLAKIPKSLTVIPQQKLQQGRSDTNSNNDLNSA